MTGPEDRPVEEPRPRRRRRWSIRILAAVVSLLVLVAAAETLIVRSGRGQRLVLDQVLGRVRGAFAGPLTVSGIRSPSLLSGATLLGVRLESADRTPFLFIDSLRVRYSILGLLAGHPRLASVTIWGPHVEVSRYPGDQSSNVSRLLRPSSSESSGGRKVPPISVSHVTIRGGDVTILSPLDPGSSPRFQRIPSPDGQGELRRIGLDSIDADVQDVLLQLSGKMPLVGTVDALSFNARLFEEPVRVVDAKGLLSYGDRGLDLRNATVRLPSSTLGGGVRLGPASPGDSSWAVVMDLRTRGRGSLADLEWVDPRIPNGTFAGGIGVTAGAALTVTFHDLDVDLEASRFRLDGGVTFADQPRLDDMTISAHPLLMSRLEPWLDRKLPLDGWLSGNLTASGTPGALSTTGRVTLVPIGYGSVPSTADFQGIFHAGTDPGATNLHMRLDPLNFGLVSVAVPNLDLPRSGSATLDLSGRVDSGVRMLLNVREGEGSDSASNVWVRGSFRRTERGWTTDLRSELSPLALGLVASLRPDLKLGGMVRGSLQAVGPLDNLRLTGNLEAGGGTARLDGTTDVRDLASGYRVDATLAGMRVSDLVQRLPAPSTWSGRLALQGRGLSPDSAEVSASVEVGRSRVGGMHVDTLAMRLRASGGTLGIDTVVADLGGLKLAGAGRLGLAPSSEGEADFRFSSDSLIGLRSILMGDTVIARDTLSALERELLRFQGVNPDALPDTADVAMSGSLQGRAHIGGSIHSLDVEGSAVLRSGVYRTNRVDSVTADVTAHGLRSDSGTVRVSADASGVEAFDRTFEGVHLEGTLSNGAGQGALEVRRRAGEVYATSGSFALDSVGGSVELQEASAVFDSVTWRMEGPTRIVWDSASLSIDSLHVARAGTEPMKVTATGTLSRAGDSDFHLDASNVRLARLARMAQLESLDLGGFLDLAVDVTGPATAPLMRGSLVVREPRYGDLQLARVGGEISYRDRAADLQIEAWSPARKVLTVAGTVPIDLTLTRQPRRTLATPMDVSVRADSLDAAVALSYFSVLQDVTGTVSGDFRVRGTVDRPEPSGVLELQNAAWSIEPIGVRHSSVNGRLTLNPDRTVNVQVATRATGTSDITGTLTLEPVSDPQLDLKIHFAGFQAVNRRDVAGKISGDLTLSGSYRKPAVGGSLTVDQGTLYLEEFARSAEVVDLTDPDVFNVVDTTILSSRPILADLRNPFLENLRVSIDLSVPRDTWLRSEDMNVEIGGELIVTYDRLKRDLVMVGELNALRGSYTVLGRRFDVQSGTVGFIGTPGINPTLNIQAVSRIRRVGNDPLSVTATVSGTLTQPRVSLSTDEQAVPQSDLVSYLVFGRPAHELSSGQNALVQGATGGAVSYLVGTAATQLSTAVAQKIGVDYLSISQADYEAGNVGILSAAIQNPQVEIGQYLNQNVFVVVVLRRPAEGGSSTSWLGGARVELALSDNYNAEGFVEDRFLRTGSPGFGELGQNSQVLGVFVYREWGY